MKMHVMKRFVAVVALIGVALVGASCGSDGEASDGASSDGGSTEGVVVDGAWARTSPGSAENGAAYMVLTSGSDNALVGASAAEEVAATVEIHETVMADADMSDGSDDEGHSDMGGAMSMQQVSSVALPAGEAVALEPGGFHVMLLGLVEPLEAGRTFTLTLDFEDGTRQDVEVTVRDDAP